MDRKTEYAQKLMCEFGQEDEVYEQRKGNEVNTTYTRWLSPQEAVVKINVDAGAF